MLNKLDNEQEAAVNASGNVLLIACPGSGKTHTLVNKVAKELSAIETHREFIIAITYTNNAAEEMKTRIKRMGIDVSQLWVGTIHSFCLEWILRPYSMYTEAVSGNFEIIDEKKQEMIIKTCLGGASGAEITKDNIDSYRVHEIARGFKEFGGYGDENMRLHVEAYRDYLKNNNMADFHTILECSLEILRNNQIIAENLSNIFPLIAIDEYQDTSILQYLILSKITKVGETRLFIVGDPNQGIYTTVGNVILEHSELEKLMEIEFAKYVLINNYRSSSKIVEYSKKYMVEHVDMVSSGSLCEYSSDIRYLSYCEDEFDLYEKIKEIVEYNINTLSIDPSEICILAPWWSHLAPLAQRLGDKLPNISVDGVRASAFWDVKNNVWYKISRLAFTEPSIELYRKRLFWAQEFLDQITQDFGYVNNLIAPIDLLDASNEIRSILAEKWTGNQRAELYLRDFFKQIIEYMEVKPPVLNMLEESVNLFFEGFRRKVESVKNIDIGSLEACKKVFNPGQGIKISTIHGVKGEEYDTVILFAALDGCIPHYTVPANKAKNNAKKLLYVTASRARKNLWIISEKREFYRSYKLPCEYVEKP
ncbi:ATP-dependent helicase [Rothia mucilaginosa]|jgi:hypothetical protein|uniref:ATP-dependent helicase n=1 Tax=Rothia mucilaginosa TaxID=43675 RepID=UPI0028DB2F88|nr:ATP-dependent helicase [Rothia mucilaginosa]